jgi:hypothetical protein
MTTARPDGADRPCAVEICIPGLLYIRVKRFPRWMLRAALTAAGAGAGWLAAGIQDCCPGNERHPARRERHRLPISAQV